MSLRDGAKRIFDVVDLKDDESDSRLCSSAVKVANSYPHSSSIVVGIKLYDAVGIAPDGAHLGSVEAKGQFGMGIERAAYSAHSVSHA